MAAAITRSSVPVPVDTLAEANLAAQARARGVALDAYLQSIIEDLGGTIAVASELKVGTTFTITLPRADS